MADSKDHPDVDELHKRVIEEKISIATVYRTVKLEEAGILEKHDFKGGKQDTNNLQMNITII